MKQKICLTMVIIFSMIFQPLAQMKVCATEYFNIQNIKCVENNKCFIARKRGQKISYEEKYTNGIIKKVYDSYLDTNDKQQEVHELKISYDIPQEIFDEKQNDVGLMTVKASGGTQSKNDSDKTGTVRCYSSITYSITKTNNKEYISITKASGGLKSLTGHTGSYQGSGITIVSNIVHVGRLGYTTSGKYSSKSKKIVCSNKPSTWTYRPTWEKVAYDTSGNLLKMNCYQTVKLKRGNKTWTFELYNSIIG